MRVRMLVCRASADQVDNAGDVIEVDNAEALRMLEAGQCEAVAEKPVSRAEKRPSGQKRETR